MDLTVPLFSMTEILDGTFFFLTFIVATFGLVGLMSKSFIVSVFSAFTMFVTLAIKTGYGFYENLLYVVIVIIFVLMAFQIFNMTKGNESGEGI